MSYLLDTNVVSEWVKPRPNTGVITWLSDIDEDRVFLSVITLVELRHGIARLPAGRRRTRLDQWMRDDILLRFESRLLPIDSGVADVCGMVLARGDARGKPIGVMDALIAATAEVHGLALVTRNATDFETATSGEIINPWIAE